MKKSIVVAAFFLVALSASAQTNPAAADTSLSAKPSNDLLPALQLRGPVPTMFATLVMQAGLSGGVATQNEGCSHGPEGAISVSAGTSFDKAVRQIATIRDKSQWQLQDGIANLFPSGSIPPLLQVRIGSFQWDKTVPVREVIARLRQLPEVSEEASKLGLKEAPLQGGSSAICIRGDCTEKPKPVAVLQTEKNATLLTLLNRIVQAHGRAVWNYSEYRCDSNVLFSFDVLTE